MLIIRKGDVLNANENIVVHQCNTMGYFGGGLAYQIKQVFPLCETQTRKWLEQKQNFMGDYYLYVDKQNNKMISNCFTQNEDYTTNYEMLEKCFKKLKNNCKDMKQSIATCYNYGCSIANGDWRIVENILIDIFDDYDITIYQI